MSAVPIRFVPLAEQHLPEILAIEQASNTAPWSPKSFKSELTHPDGIFVVAQDGFKTVGFGAVWILADEAHIINFAIDPLYRRQRIGLRLLKELLARAKESRAICATLEVRASNIGAIRMYESVGFVSVGTRRKYYPDNREDANVMWLYHLQEWSPSL